VFLVRQEPPFFVAAEEPFHRRGFALLSCPPAGRGEKIFTLLPPTDVPALRHVSCAVAQYKVTNGNSSSSFVRKSRARSTEFCR
jgi:hypothetical protein